MARIGIIRAWFLFALVVLIESKVRKPARLPEDVPLKPPAQKPKVPTEPAAEIRPANFRAHFKKRGKKCTKLKVILVFKNFPSFPTGVLYSLGGYAHLQTKVRLSEYRDALRKSCQAIHTMSHSAHKPALKHLYHAARLLDERCIRVADVANSQLRAMGDDDEWLQHQYSMDYNPFLPALKKHIRQGSQVPEPTTTSSPEVRTNRLERASEHLEKMQKVQDKLYWPSYMDEEYVKYAAKLKIEGEVCTSTDLFSKPEAHTMADLNCSMMMMPESYYSDSQYYNPLFMQHQNMTEFKRTGRIDALREVYKSHDPLRRDGRQVAAASVVTGMMFGAAMDKVLNWFGYSTTTNEDVHHINDNTAHVKALVKQLNLTQEFSKQLIEEAHDVAKREELTEMFLSMETGTQGLLDSYQSLMTGLSVLFHSREMSPLIVRQEDVMAQIAEMRSVIVSRHEIILMHSKDVWHAPVSFCVTTNLDVWIMIHIPIGKADSRRALLEYMPTPMSFMNTTTHFLANPTEPYITLSAGKPQEIKKRDLDVCEKVKDGATFCPKMGYSLENHPPTCTTSLYASEAQQVIEKCPVSLVDEDFIYITVLGYGQYSFYSRKPVLGRLLCGDVNNGTVTLVGLKSVELRMDCRIEGTDFKMVPSIDLRDESPDVDSVPILFGTNLTHVVDWGSDHGLLSSAVDGVQLTIGEVAKHWNMTMLKDHKHFNAMNFVYGFCILIISVLFSYCCVKEMCDNYHKRQARRKLKEMLDARYTRRPEADDTANEQEMVNLVPAASAPRAGIPALTGPTAPPASAAQPTQPSLASMAAYSTGWVK